MLLFDAARIQYHIQQQLLQYMDSLHYHPHKEHQLLLKEDDFQGIMLGANGK
jgi:hypothetical protein